MLAVANDKNGELLYVHMSLHTLLQRLNSFMLIRVCYYVCVAKLTLSAYVLQQGHTYLSDGQESRVLPI